MPEFQSPNCADFQTSNPTEFEAGECSAFQSKTEVTITQTNLGYGRVYGRFYGTGMQQSNEIANDLWSVETACIPFQTKAE